MAEKKSNDKQKKKKTTLPQDASLYMQRFNPVVVARHPKRGNDSEKDESGSQNSQGDSQNDSSDVDE